MIENIPASVEAEKTILGAIMLDNASFDQAAERLTAEDFHLDSHRRIFAAMASLMMKHSVIDIVTLAEALKKKRELKACGDVQYISSLMDGVPHQPSIEQYVNIVKDKKLLRNLIQSAEKTITAALEQVSDVREVAAIIHRQVVEITAEATRNKAQLIGDFANSVFTEVANQRASGRSVIGLHTSTDALDETLGGFREGENIVLAGWTGSGKSAFAMQAAAHSAKRDIPVGVFSLEMRKEELFLRLASAKSGINHLRLRNPRDLEEEDMESLAKHMSEMKGWPLWIDDSGGLTIHELCARARMMVAKGCKLLVVDYLQLIKSTRYSDTRERVNEASEGIRELAKACRVPILNLSQLSRPKEGTRRRPTIYDLKESGNIEQDAHVVGLLYRPIAQNGSFTHEDEIIIGKQRNGATGFLPHFFKGETMQWFDRDVSKDDDKAVAQKKDGKADAIASEPEQYALNT